MKTIVVRFDETRTGFLQLDYEDEDEPTADQIKERLQSYMYDGARPEYIAFRHEVDLTWEKGTPCELVEYKYASISSGDKLRTCKTHNETASSKDQRCWAWQEAREVGMEDD